MGVKFVAGSKFSMVPNSIMDLFKNRIVNSMCQYIEVVLMCTRQLWLMLPHKPTI